MSSGSRRKRGNRKKSPIFRIPHCDDPKVSVVIPVMNEIRTIAGVLRQVCKVHPKTEVIVVANGSTDGTGEFAHKMGAKVISFDGPLGHDVGRCVGARAARGEIILFTDGDIVLRTADLIPFIKAVENGVDIALNQYTGPTNRNEVHSVVLAKHALNCVLSRPDLKGVSLTTVPHAMGRRALEMIGADLLAVPPLAQAIACCSGLHLHAVHYIDVGRKNPLRRRRNGKDPLEDLIVGDHLEAIHWLVHTTNDRGNKTDLTRIRSMVR